MKDRVYIQPENRHKKRHSIKPCLHYFHKPINIVLSFFNNKTTQTKIRDKQTVSILCDIITSYKQNVPIATKRQKNTNEKV